MKATESLECLQRTLEHAGSRGVEMELVIPVVSQGGIGGTPCVTVKSIHAGIDWDNNKIFVRPDQELTSLTPGQVAEISESVRKGQSWHAYEAHKAHKQKLQAMQEEIDRKNAALACAIEAISWAIGHTPSDFLEGHLKTVRGAIAPIELGTDK